MAAESVNIISIHSHKGGTGKTTIALGLASLLAECVGSDAVYLIDADLTGASMDYVFPNLKKAAKNLGNYLIQDPFHEEDMAKLDNMRWKISIPYNGETRGPVVEFWCISSPAEFSQVREPVAVKVQA